ncbi:MAG: hypothetical protein U0941_06350 [Planctomycetaceae bacterium]
MSSENHDDPKVMSWGSAFGRGLLWMFVSLIPIYLLVVILANSQLLPPPDNPNGPYHAVRFGIALWVVGVPVLSSLFHKSRKPAVAIAISLTVVAIVAGTLLFIAFMSASRVWH